MSQPTDLSPAHQLSATNDIHDMAQTKQAPSLLRANILERMDQHHLGPQLPPLQSIPLGQSEYDDGNHPVRLPPMQVLQPKTVSPSRSKAIRSIPVAHLLSNDSPSPPNLQLAVPAQPTMSFPSLASSYDTSPAQWRLPSLLYPQTAHHRLDQGPTQPRRHSERPTAYQVQQQYSPPHLSPLHPLVQPEQAPARLFSPAVSTYSSPSYTQSDASPRSSVGSQGVSRRPQVSTIPSLNYDINIRQQPAAARACGFGERDRRVVDPPPILELKITDRVTGYPEHDSTAMLALHCTLLSPEGQDDETELPPPQPDMPSARRLVGTLVASPYQAKDENRLAGTFFVFPDLSCRSPGRYRLQFKLLRVDPTNMTPGTVHGSVASITTDVFSVYTAKEFPGMRASSALLKTLQKQGLNVGVKKGSEARKGKGKTKKEASSPSSSEGENDSDGARDGAGPGSEGAVSPKVKIRSKTKRTRRET